MKKVLLIVFVLLLVKILPAQSTSVGTASVTIVHAIGTEEVGAELPSFSSASWVQSPNSFSGSASILNTGKTVVKKFRVIDQSFIHSIAVIPYVTQNQVLQKMNKNVLKIDINTIAEAQKKAVIFLGTSAESLPCLAGWKEEVAPPDVVVHFN
ncbi:MAG: hypothetical protein M3Q06_12175 [Bacteroidota bacterium]|nr:hypothetical protein [Bacteroidota bacterium]